VQYLTTRKENAQAGKKADSGFRAKTRREQATPIQGHGPLRRRGNECPNRTDYSNFSFLEWYKNGKTVLRDVMKKKVVVRTESGSPSSP
jgi:hypothetical protein